MRIILKTIMLLFLTTFTFSVLNELELEGFENVETLQLNFLSNYLTSQFNPVTFLEAKKKDVKNYVAIIKFKKVQCWLSFFFDLESEQEKFMKLDLDEQLVELLDNSLSDVDPCTQEIINVVFSKVIAKTNLVSFNSLLGDLIQDHEDELIEAVDHEYATVGMTRMVKHKPLKDVEDSLLDEYSQRMFMTQLGLELMSLKRTFDAIPIMSLLVRPLGKSDAKPCEMVLNYKSDDFHMPYVLNKTLNSQFSGFNKCPSMSVYSFTKVLNELDYERQMNKLRSNNKSQWIAVPDGIKESIQKYLDLQSMNLNGFGEMLYQPIGNIYFAIPVQDLETAEAYVLFLSMEIKNKRVIVLDGTKNSTLMTASRNVFFMPFDPANEKINQQVQKHLLTVPLFLAIMYCRVEKLVNHLNELITVNQWQTWHIMSIPMMEAVTKLLKAEQMKTYPLFGMSKRDDSEYILFLVDDKMKFSYMNVAYDISNGQVSFPKENSLKIEANFGQKVYIKASKEVISEYQGLQSRLLI